MNSGIASMVKDCVVDKERCTKMVHGISGLVKKNAKPETAMANATGMPKNNITKKNPCLLYTSSADPARSLTDALRTGRSAVQSQIPLMEWNSVLLGHVHRK